MCTVELDPNIETEDRERARETLTYSLGQGVGVCHRIDKEEADRHFADQQLDALPR
jgi:hypothetical protein